jgi:hypothetical protein
VRLVAGTHRLLAEVVGAAVLGAVTWFVKVPDGIWQIVLVLGALFLGLEIWLIRMAIRGGTLTSMLLAALRISVSYFGSRVLITMVMYGERPYTYSSALIICLLVPCMSLIIPFIVWKAESGLRKNRGGRVVY